MAAFASSRRAGWVRVLVLLLCCLFAFSVLFAPAVHAEALTIGLVTAAAALSCVTAAMGFKLANSETGQATLEKMVSAFKAAAFVEGMVVIGNDVNGLVKGVQYVKTQVKNGKTYIDSRVCAWVQQWLSSQGVYNTGSYTAPSMPAGKTYMKIENPPQVNPLSIPAMAEVIKTMSGWAAVDFSGTVARWESIDSNFHPQVLYVTASPYKISSYEVDRQYTQYSWFKILTSDSAPVYPSVYCWHYDKTKDYWTYYGRGGYTSVFGSFTAPVGYDCPFNIGSVSPSGVQTTGLSGTDTLGKDMVDPTLEQILSGMKEWAQDWWDAGVVSATDTAAGAIDLPISLGSDVGVVEANPALTPELVYIPWFEKTLEDLRSGESSSTVTDSAISSAAAADKAEAATGSLADAQDVVSSLVDWALSYISPDKGLFSKFPLCIPYDAYLMVCSALGVDAAGIGEVTGKSPGDVSFMSLDDGVAVQSDFQPVIHISHDWTQDGKTTPLDLTIDLSTLTPVVKMVRALVSVYVLAELIASEYKRIRGS